MSFIVSLYKNLQRLYTIIYVVFKPNLKIGKNSIINITTCITGCWFPEGGVEIGNNCGIGVRRNSNTIGHFHKTTLSIKSPKAKILIGDNTNLNGVYVGCRENIQIGKNCRIATGCTIIDYNGHVTFSKNRTSGRDTPCPIIIGDNVWIGINSIVLKGTVIGNNSIISAGSVVKGVFPDNCIISGNPARIVKVMDM